MSVVNYAVLCNTPEVAGEGIPADGEPGKASQPDARSIAVAPWMPSTPDFGTDIAVINIAFAEPGVSGHSMCPAPSTTAQLMWHSVCLSQPTTTRHIGRRQMLIGVAPSGVQGAVRRDRVDGVAVVRGHRRGGSPRAVADPAARRGVLTRSRPKHSRSPCGAAGGADAGWHLKLPAPTAPGLAHYRKRRCANNCGSLVRDRPRPAGSAGRADQHSRQICWRRGDRWLQVLREHAAIGRGIPLAGAADGNYRLAQ